MSKSKKSKGPAAQAPHPATSEKKADLNPRALLAGAVKVLPPKGRRAHPSTNKKKSDLNPLPADSKGKVGGKARPPRKRGEPKEELVVFAFRLTAEEREAIHKAAGAAKASRFVRTLAVAAAHRDEAKLRELVKFAGSTS